jgi:Ca2+-binding EF-hand superfamily protein
MAIHALWPLFAAIGGSASNIPAPPPVTRHWGSIFVSPMGQPFHADHADALAAWFAEADTNHDGYLTLDEMQADAERFFAKLDTNHDGEIDPDELEHYETVIAPETQNGTYESDAPRENQTHQGASRFGLFDLPEPVASADENLDRGVSLEEFRHAAHERFNALDLDHRGRLSLAALEMTRPPPGPTPHKSDDQPADIDTESVP